MVETARYEYEGLSTRDGFNRSLRHFKAVSEVIKEFEGQRNLADLLNEMLGEKQLEFNQIDPIVHALLVGHPKYVYASCSLNLPETITDFKPLVEETSRWNAVDIVLAYHHPDLGLTLINPKNEAHWTAAQTLKKNELITIYAGAFAAGGKDGLIKEAAERMADLLKGKSFKTPASFTKGSFRPPRPARPPRAEAAPRSRAAKKAVGRPPKAAARPKEQAAAVTEPAAAALAPPSGRPRQMTPMYSIPVTNELFHNGNVEAWKRIIASYRGKHPGLDVFVFYEGERIHDINTLFKWGKVKHGSAIMIAVAGENIQDVAKLQRYLRQGASPMFEAFLRFPVNTVLNLF